MSYRKSPKYEFLSEGTIAGALIAALLASIVFAELLAATGHLETVAAVYALDLGNDWAFVVAHGLVAAGPFIAALTYGARARAAPAPLAGAVRSPFLGGCFGVAYGTVCWLVVIAYGVPYVLRLTGADLPLPVHHSASLVALLAYGAVLGSWYPLVRTAIADRTPRS